MITNDDKEKNVENYRMSKKIVKKSFRKQKRASHRLLRDMNIKCCDNPTQNLMICNGGLVTGLQRETLQSHIDPLISKYKLIMPPGKSYSFIKFHSTDDAIHVHNVIHGRVKLDEQNTMLYSSFVESVPDTNHDEQTSDLPPGLILKENIITEEEENTLLSTLDWSNEESIASGMKHRKVKHFGYEFQYGSNKVNPDNPITPIPESNQFLQAIFQKVHPVTYEYDQLTINHYLPGQGIPPHIDTHSVFEDTILALSLGSSCVMDFKKDEKKISVFLPPRSLLIMSGEARYAWSHGICPRHNDIVETENGITTQPRGTRVSFTFRKVRRGDCQCTFSRYCDTKQNCTTFIDNKTATGIENSYVHEVYEEISSHFNETRHKQWPNVTKFLKNLNIGDILLDAGCGNGKYLQENECLFKMGCDRSHSLMEICRGKGFEVLLSDCLRLPYKNNSLDAAISIAVIHHLSTPKRRRQAISELARVLRPNGKCLIYVWAKEQEKNSTQSAYLKQNSNKRGKENEIECTKTLTEYGLTLPVHESRTNFTSCDMLVPWKRKGGGNFLRYYHVFEEGELAQLCSEVSSIAIDKVYYDQGNWCVIFQKKYEIS